MAPEVRSKHQVSTKSDVYSFGVLLIEIVSGKKTFNVEGENLSLRDFTEWAQWNHVEGEFEDILDGVINNSIVDLNHNEAQKLMKIALECIQVQNFNLCKNNSCGYLKFIVNHLSNHIQIHKFYLIRMCIRIFQIVL
jgi:serine/threonine protein kinase